MWNRGGEDDPDKIQNKKQQDSENTHKDGNDLPQKQMARRKLEYSPIRCVKGFKNESTDKGKH